jgi:hypothetical protein
MRRGHRHLAIPGDPGGSGDAAVDEVGAGLLSIARLGAKVTIQRVDGASIRDEIYAAALAASKEFVRGCEPLLEGCSPFPQHEKSLANKRSRVK